MTLVLLNSSLVQAGFFDCVCNFITGKAKSERVVSCIPDTTLYHLKDLTPNQAYQLTLKNGKTYEGLVKSMNFEKIELFNGSKIITLKPHELNLIKSSAQKYPLQATEADLLKSSAIKKYIADAEIRKNYFRQNKESLVQELNHLKSLTKEAQENFVKKYAIEVEAKLKAKYGTQNIGYHFNNNGGLGYQFAESGGIYATMGDLGTQMGLAQDFSIRVYLFKSEQYSLFDIINQYRMKNITQSGRMGDELILINLDHQYFKQAIAEKGIIETNDISYKFNSNWLSKQKINHYREGSHVGIPFEAFLFSPAPVYQKQLRHWLDVGSLGRMEENYLALKSLASQL
jgi:hypothetical protein